ncbi:MAG TPA: hypothetical protein DEP69_04305, partial [Acidimicrobiaceae bacterium]|nr:hypothetical protein [Acidimicrobiaceae bacterium]
DGYRVLARNWRCPAGELDLVVADDRQIVFCEVKTRASSRFGTGFEAVTADKQRRVRRLAAEFLRRAGRAGSDDAAGSAAADGLEPGAARHIRAVRGRLRFDVASIVAGRIEVMQAAF